MNETERVNAKNTRLIAAATILAALIPEERMKRGLHPEELAMDAVRMFLSLENALENSDD